MKKFLCFMLILALSMATSVAEIPPDYKQSDKRWADYPYTICNNSNQTIGNCGCGIVAMCDIIACWYDPEITPIELAELSMHKFNTCAATGGTYPSFFSKIAQEYPFSDFKESDDIQFAIQCLEEGGLVIVLFEGGYWSIPGEDSMHACCLYSYSVEDEFRVLDPAWADEVLSMIMGHVFYEDMIEYGKYFYCYWK